MKFCFSSRLFFQIPVSVTGRELAALLLKVQLSRNSRSFAGHLLLVPSLCPLAAFFGSGLSESANHRLEA